MRRNRLLFFIFFASALLNQGYTQHTYAEFDKHIVGNENSSFDHILFDGDAIIVNGYWFLEADYDGLELPYHIGSNGLIVKMDLTGNIIWHSTMTGDNFDTFFDIELDSENNIIAAGWSSSNEYIEINGDTVYEPDMEWTQRGVVAKFSGEDGSLIWLKVINPGEAYLNLSVTKVGVDAQDNVFISGYSNVGFEIEDVEFPYTQEGWGSLTFMAKLDPEGSIIWGKQFHFVQEGVAGWSMPRSIELNNEEIFLALQYSKPVIVDDGILPYEGNGDFDWIGLIKLSSQDGQVIHTYAYGSSSDQNIASLKLDHDGNILIAGFFTSDSDFSIDGLIPRSYGLEDGYVAKMNNEFDLIWLQSMGSEFSSRCFNLSVSQDNRIFVGGGFDSYTPLYFEEHHLIDGESPTNSLAMFQVILNEDGEFEKAFALHGDDIYSIVENKSSILLGDDALIAVGASLDYVSFVEGDPFYSDHWAGFMIKWDLSKEYNKIFFEVKDESGNALYDAVVSLEGFSNPFNKHSFYQADQGIYGYTVSLEGYTEVEGEVEVFNQDIVVPVILTSISTAVKPEVSPSTIVFPNPVKTTLSIVSDSIIEDIRIFDITGREVYIGEVNVNPAQVGIEGLSEGLHIVRIRTKNGVSTHKIHIRK